MDKTIAIVVGILTIISIIAKLIYNIWINSLKKSVRYRAIIKLKHIRTGHMLHSHNHRYRHPNTSGQQQVTAYADADSNDYWVIKGPHEKSEFYREGKAVKHGELIRLEHKNTGKNLHSHRDTPSPLTNQQEVTAFGTNGIGDSNDNWRVEVEGSGWWFHGRWYKEKRVKLIHVNTGHALHSHMGNSHSEYTEGQQEVTCYKDRDDNDWWTISEVSYQLSDRGHG